MKSCLACGACFWGPADRSRVASLLMDIREPEAGMELARNVEQQYRECNYCHTLAKVELINSDETDTDPQAAEFPGLLNPPRSFAEEYAPVLAQLMKVVQDSKPSRLERLVMGLIRRAPFALVTDIDEAKAIVNGALLLDQALTEGGTIRSLTPDLTGISHTQFTDTALTGLGITDDHPAQVLGIALDAAIIFGALQVHADVVDPSSGFRDTDNLLKQYREKIERLKVLVAS